MAAAKYSPLASQSTSNLAESSSSTINANGNGNGNGHPTISIRPATYYNDGTPFDPPSSPDDDEGLGELEDESLLSAEKGRFTNGSVPPSPRVAETGGLVVGGGRKGMSTRLKFLLGTLLGLVVLSGLIGIFAARNYVGTTYRPPGSKKITMDHVFNGTFYADRRSVEWVPEAGDGVFSLQEDNLIKLVDLKTNKTTTLLDVSDIRDANGRQIWMVDWKLSPDMKRVLVRTDYRKLWRHSSHTNIYIHTIATKETKPLVPPSNPPLTSYAAWAPKGESVGFVWRGDIYVWVGDASLSLTPPHPGWGADIVRLTTSGENSTTVMNGIPPWVYEEEVFGSDWTMWFSGGAGGASSTPSYLSFLTFNESLVPIYQFPVYNPTQDSDKIFPYFDEVKVPYPKPGYENPRVGVWVWDFGGWLGAVRGSSTSSSIGVSPFESTMAEHDVGEDAIGFLPLPPTVKDHLYELTWPGRLEPSESIVMEVSWVGEREVILKEVNRSGDEGKVILFDLREVDKAEPPKGSHHKKLVGKVVRKKGKNGEEGDSGWIDNKQTIHVLPSAPSGVLKDLSTLAYLDILPTPQGFNHIALFYPLDSSTPIFLTNGSWEVAGNVESVDKEGRVWFLSAGSGSAEGGGGETFGTGRHLQYVTIPSLEQVKKLESGTEDDRRKGMKITQMAPCLVNASSPIAPALLRNTLSSTVASSISARPASEPSLEDLSLVSVLSPSGKTTGTVEVAGKEVKGNVSYYGVDFSPEGGFYLLSYEGPGVPWQRIVKAGDESFDYVLTTNDEFRAIVKQFEAPTVIYSTIMSEGYELNVKELRPPRMDDSGRTKYPVLFRVYGGPFSQMVSLEYGRDWHDYLVCGLGYIVVTVDGRGTGFKGRKLRNPVKGDLGFFETRDQIEAAKIWREKSYVDKGRIGIWGWSYGGFMSSKVVEADAGVHSLALAVAPVTSWLLYDSIYTERYMGLPKDNPGGYVNASISNVTAFQKVDYFLAHGSADDNVHFQNSARLLDMLTVAHVRNFRFRMFTDSDHSINKRGGYRELHEYMTNFLIEKWGKGGRKVGW